MWYFLYQYQSVRNTKKLKKRFGVNISMQSSLSMYMCMAGQRYEYVVDKAVFFVGDTVQDGW